MQVSLMPPKVGGLAQFRPQSQVIFSPLEFGRLRISWFEGLPLPIQSL